MEALNILKEKFYYVLQELEINASDYEFRRSIKERYMGRSRWFGFLKLDLLNYIKRFQNKYDLADKRLTYTGNVYKTFYWRRLNKEIKNYYNISQKNCYSPYSRDGRMILADSDATKYFIYKYNQKEKQKEKDFVELTELTPEMNDEWISKYLLNYNPKGKGIGFYDWQNETSLEYDKDNGFVIPVRKAYKKLDYKGEMRKLWSPLNLKYWDKNTMKTSNKGLKADTTWSYVSDNKCGWTFGGIKAYDLEWFCLKNGFKKEKGKKYQYGDYANWFLHILE